MRLCLEPGCRVRTEGRRCEAHQQAEDRRHYRAQGGLYRGDSGHWQRTSRAAIREVGYCQVCGTTDDLTLDHTSGLVCCRSCHRPESVGGVRRRLVG